MKISIRSQGQWFLSTQPLLQHLKNTGKHTFLPTPQWTEGQSLVLDKS